ncbi:MAG: hypothetical protein U0805_10040 [Pirellulales bacterium]
MDSIRARLEAVRSRQQRQWVWQCCSWGLVIGGLAGCLLATFRAVSNDSFPWVAVLGAMIAGPAASWLYAILRPRALREAAVAIDRSCGLKDRVTTALVFVGESSSATPFRELQIKDAAQHLARVDPEQIVPVRAPKSWLWGLGLSASALVIAFMTTAPPKAEATVIVNDVVSAQAVRVTSNLEKLKEFQHESADPEVEKLLKELAAMVEELKQPGVDPKEALAKLSEMEAALQEQQRQLADQNAETSLKEVGETLSLAQELQAAGEAMSHGNMEKAAAELAKAEMPNLDRKTEKALTEKLDQQAKNNAGGGSQKALREATEQVSQGLTSGDRSKFRDGMHGLASECKKQGQRKKLTDLLRKQCQCLCECKSECECECKNDSESNKKGGKNWGLARSGNQPGDKTPKLKTGQEMKLTGQESVSGESDVETLEAAEQQQNAVRQYRDQAKKYEQLAESALDAEPIPLGHRQTIRRYFELIHPQKSEMDAVVAPLESE